MDEPYEECDQTECYVCYEPCDTLANCKCKTLYVHDSCITIMRLYGKTHCGVCREPYPRIEIPLELIEEEESEQFPCCCYMVPTAFRGSISNIDKCLDVVRYLIIMIFLTWVIFGFSLYLPPNTLSAAVTIMFVVIICCCFVLEQQIRQQQHSLYLQTRHETMDV